MSSPVSLSVSTISHQAQVTEKDVSLKNIRDARGDIKEIRLLLQGSKEACLHLFREAVEEDDVISQIELSQAFFGIQWGKDNEKDFSSIDYRDLEEFSYYPKEFLLFNLVYEKAMKVPCDWKARKVRSTETFTRASEMGYLPATLELKHAQWKWNSNSYGFAVELLPFVGKGDRKIDYCFGKALKNGCQAGSKLYYEGLHWMEQSIGVPVKYPPKGQSFDDFFRRYVRFEDASSTYYNHDGFWHIGPSVILAPSEEAWRTFVSEKLKDISIATPESYLFAYNAEEINTLLNECKIGAVQVSSFVDCSASEQAVEDFDGSKIFGFRINSLSIDENHVPIGEISVREDTFEIYQTFENPKIQPVITFIENVMKKSGSAGSAHAWLRQMGGYYI